MPHVTLPVTALGPIIDVSLGISRAREDALKKAGQSIPARVMLRALVDTGASCSCVDSTAIGKLGITPTGTSQMHTGSTGGVAHACNEYDVSFLFLLPGMNIEMAVVPVSEINLSGANFDALLGRDILARCLLVYDGRANLFMLSF